MNLVGNSRKHLYPFLHGRHLALAPAYLVGSVILAPLTILYVIYGFRRRSLSRATWAFALNASRSWVRSCHGIVCVVARVALNRLGSFLDKLNLVNNEMSTMDQAKTYIAIVN